MTKQKAPEKPVRDRRWLYAPMVRRVAGRTSSSWDDDTRKGFARMMAAEFPRIAMQLAEDLMAGLEDLRRTEITDTEEPPPGPPDQEELEQPTPAQEED